MEEPRIPWSKWAHPSAGGSAAEALGKTTQERDRERVAAAMSASAAKKAAAEAEAEASTAAARSKLVAIEQKLRSTSGALLSEARPGTGGRRAQG